MNKEGCLSVRKADDNDPEARCFGVGLIIKNLKNGIMLREINTRAVVAPLPVLIIGSYDANEEPDAMNVAWGGQCWDKQIAINISSNHKTTENIRLNQAFTVHIANAERVALADYVGVTSGRKGDKLSRVNATIVRGKMVNAPIIEEFVLAMECKVVSMVDNGDGGVRIVGEVVRTVADDTIIGIDGKIDYNRLKPITYDAEHNIYRTIGDGIAEAFKIGKTLMGE